MSFSLDIKNNRFDIPNNFKNDYEKRYMKFEPNDFLLLEINNRIVPASVNISIDRNRIRKKIKIPKVFCNHSIPDARISIKSHIKPKEPRYDNNKAIKNKKVDLYYAIPDEDDDGNKIVIGLNGKYMFLMKQFASKTVRIKRYVDIEKFLEIMGLYQGEGLRNSKRIQKLQFSNNLPELINKFLDFFETIGLTRKYWKISVVLTGNVDSGRENKSKRYWLLKTGVPSKNFRGFGYTKTFGDIHSYMGTCVSIYDSSVLARTVVALLNRIREFIKDERNAWLFMNGLLEADGSVEVKKDFLSEINLAYDTPEEANFYTDFIEKYLNIETKIRERKRIVVFKKCKKTGDKWMVWYKLVKFDIFKDHNERKRKLIVGFLKHKKTGILYKCLNGLENNIASTQDILKTTSYKEKASVIHAMKQLERQGFVSITKDGRRFVYRITGNGKSFIKTYRKIRHQYALAK